MFVFNLYKFINIYILYIFNIGCGSVKIIFFLLLYDFFYLSIEVYIGCLYIIFLLVFYVESRFFGKIILLLNYI